MGDSYSYDDSNSTEGRGHGDFVLGVVVGATVGAAVALLYAPMRGREAREMIGERVQQGVDRANAAIDKGRELAAQGRGVVADARSAVGQALDEGKQVYRRVKENA